MSETIRELKRSDLYEVSELYQFRKSEKELEWLFSNPNSSGKFNAFVSTNDKKEITGVIGFVKSNYKWNDKIYVGVIPMSWKLKDSYKGMAGVLLFKKALAQGEFGFTIEGSNKAKKLYPMFKLNHFSEVDVYYKVLSLSKYLKSFRNNCNLDRFKMLVYLFPTWLNMSKKNLTSCNIRLIPYVGDNFVEEKASRNVFNKVITKNYIDWLLNCPMLKSYGFIIEVDNDQLGICVLYIQKISNTFQGRIVHLPFLQYDEKIWVRVVSKCLDFFKNEKCISVTGLAHHNMYHSTFEKSGFRKVKKHSKPISLKDPNLVLSNIKTMNWNLQYTEGDKAYRI